MFLKLIPLFGLMRTTLCLYSQITTLGLQGGFDVKDTVWRVMRCTVTNSLAKQLNWRGINGKAGEVIIGMLFSSDFVGYALPTFVQVN